MGAFFPTQEAWLKAVDTKTEQEKTADKMEAPFTNGQYKYNDPWNESETAFELLFKEDDKTISGKGTDSQRGEYIIKGRYCKSNTRIAFSKEFTNQSTANCNWQVRLEWKEEDKIFRGTEKITVKVGCFNNATVYDCSVKFIS